MQKVKLGDKDPLSLWKCKNWISPFETKLLF